MAAKLGLDHAATKTAITKAEEAERKAEQAYQRIGVARAAARKGFIKVIRPKKAAKVEAANTLAPTIAQAAKEGMMFVGQILSSTVCPRLIVEFEMVLPGRISRSFGGKITVAADADASTVVHELGHEIEDQAGVKQATVAFPKHRCG